MSKFRWLMLMATVAMLGTLFTSVVAYAQEGEAQAGETQEEEKTQAQTGSIFAEVDNGHTWIFDEDIRECVENGASGYKYESQDECKAAHPYKWYYDVHNEYGGGCVKLVYGGDYPNKNECESSAQGTWIFDEDRDPYPRCVDTFGFAGPDEEYYSSQGDCEVAHPYKWYYKPSEDKCLDIGHGGNYKTKEDCEYHNNLN